MQIRGRSHDEPKDELLRHETLAFVQVTEVSEGGIVQRMRVKNSKTSIVVSALSDAYAKREADLRQFRGGLLLGEAAGVVACGRFGGEGGVQLAVAFRVKYDVGAEFQSR